VHCSGLEGCSSASRASNTALSSSAPLLGSRSSIGLRTCSRSSGMDTKSLTFPRLNFSEHACGFPADGHESSSYSMGYDTHICIVERGSVGDAFAWRFGDAPNHIAHGSPGGAVQESGPRWRSSPSSSLHLRQRRLGLWQPEAHIHTSIHLDSRRQRGTGLLPLAGHGI
jgi:hypothetical protein